MQSKPNAVLLNAINCNQHSEGSLRRQRLNILVAIKTWSPGGDLYNENKHDTSLTEEQKGYFTEALTLLDKHLNKFNRKAA